MWVWIRPGPARAVAACARRAAPGLARRVALAVPHGFASRVALGPVLGIAAGLATGVAIAEPIRLTGIVCAGQQLEFDYDTRPMTCAAPVAGIDVALGVGSRVLRVKTDRDGRFAFEPVEPASSSWISAGSGVLSGLRIAGVLDDTGVRGGNTHLRFLLPPST